jgi:hypothetical protein
MVRSYILTDREREIIKFYLENGRSLNGFRELKFLTKGLDINRLKEDLELIEKFLGEEKASA